ncbi:hypothetical protein Q5P01_000958 [Channa striata]|uniref:Uncharacterized protein n=1 Tax=Channa striata TaxID=64152 RepID=A0AA88IJF6_CHASR|nr:hypothetical protein Q5P01_000958 [Channa striata]
METLLLLLVLCRPSSPLNHTLKFFLTASSGVPDLPDFMAAAELDGVRTGYCDSKNRTEVKQDAWKRFLGENPLLAHFFTRRCLETMPKVFRAQISAVMQPLNQSGGCPVVLPQIWVRACGIYHGNQSDTEVAMETTEKNMRTVRFRGGEQVRGGTSM